MIEHAFGNHFVIREPLPDGLFEWVLECTSHYGFRDMTKFPKGTLIYFGNDEEAVAFKLRWC